MAETDFVIGTIFALLLVLVGVYVAYRGEKRKARAAILYSAKRESYAGLVSIIDDFTLIVQGLSMVQSVDVAKKDEVLGNLAKVLGGAIWWISPDILEVIDEEIPDAEETEDGDLKDEEALAELLRQVMEIVVREGWLRYTVVSREFRTEADAFDFLEASDEVRRDLEVVSGLIFNQATSISSQSILERAGYKGLVPPQPSQDWTNQVAGAIGKLKESMKMDLRETL